MLVEDEDRAIFALCTRRMAREAIGGKLLSLSGVEIASTESLPAIGAEATACDLLSLFRVDRDVLVDFRMKSSRNPPALPAGLLSKRVIKHDDEGLQTAVVTALHAEVRISRGDGETLIRGAIEIEPDHPDAFAGRDNGGALMITEQGEPFGILVAGEDDCFFAAPILPWLSDRRLKPLTAGAARRHNEPFTTSIFDISSIEDRNGAFSYAMLEPQSVDAAAHERRKLAVDSFCAKFERPDMALAYDI